MIVDLNFLINNSCIMNEEVKEIYPIIEKEVKYTDGNDLDLTRIPLQLNSIYQSISYPEQSKTTKF